MNFLVLVFVLEVVLGFPAPAGAYTDPNLGNLVFQILFPIITVLSTGYLLCKKYIKRKVNALMHLFKDKITKNPL
jgi:hypothetical protein